MSEAELHVLRSRLRGGILNKARRGGLRRPLPVGLVHDAAGCVVLDPDKQVQESVRLLFATFTRGGSVSATIKHFRQAGLLFPTRVAAGARKGELLWVPLWLSRAARTLPNPAYAVHVRPLSLAQDARGAWPNRPLPKDEWFALIKDAHPAYISWEEHERIEKQLQHSARALCWQRQIPARGPRPTIPPGAARLRTADNCSGSTARPRTRLG